MLYGLEKELDSVFSGTFGAKWEEVNKTTVTKCDKGTLVNLVLTAARVLGKSKDTLRSASVRIEELTQEVLSNQNTLLTLQDDLLKSKSEQMEAVQTTVKTEIRSFSDVVKQGCEDKITATQVKAAVKSAVKDDDRRKAVMVFGLEESADEVVREKVRDVLSTSCSTAPPFFSDCHRVGGVQAGSVRPVKVTFHSSETAASVLRNGKNLRGTRFSRVFMSPDRTREEREERKHLVSQLREKVRSDPGRYHYISNGTVCSRERQPTPSPRTTPPSSSSQPALPSVIPHTTPRSALNPVNVSNLRTASRRTGLAEHPPPSPYPPF